MKIAQEKNIQTASESEEDITTLLICFKKRYKKIISESQGFSA